KQLRTRRYDTRRESPLLSKRGNGYFGPSARRQRCKGDDDNFWAVLAALEHHSCEVEIRTRHVGSVTHGYRFGAALGIRGPEEPPAADRAASGVGSRSLHRSDGGDSTRNGQIHDQITQKFRIGPSNMEEGPKELLHRCHTI